MNGNDYDRIPQGFPPVTLLQSFALSGNSSKSNKSYGELAIFGMEAAETAGSVVFPMTFKRLFSVPAGIAFLVSGFMFYFACHYLNHYLNMYLNVSTHRVYFP